MGEVAATPAAHGPRSYRWLAAPLLAFALFSLTAGLLARHEPRSKGYFQLFTAAWIFRKLPWRKPAWVNPVHRWSGRLAFAFTLPVAYHCIFKLGFREPDTRVFAHSLLGCGVYGAFAAKVTIVRLHRFPRPVLPIAGGLLFAILIGVWYSSALWLYRQDAKAAPPPTPAPAVSTASTASTAATATTAPTGGDAAAGATVFESAGCGGCHTLQAAGASGQIGPNLDDLRPSFEQVQAKVENGGGGMPAYSGQLTPQEIKDVAAFVSERAGGG